MSETTRDVELEALARQLREALHGAEGIVAVEERLILAALRRVQPEPRTYWHHIHCNGSNLFPIGDGHGCNCERWLKAGMPEPSAEGPTEAQVKALPVWRHAVWVVDASSPRGRYIPAISRDDVLALFAPPAADAEPEKETP